MKQIITLTLIALTIVTTLQSCSKEQPDEFNFDGKWIYESSNPEIDQSYHNSYIEINSDKTFVIYDSSRSLLIDGGEEKISSSGLTVTDPQTNETYRFSLKGIENNRMTIETSFFEKNTTIILLHT
jgi:hypothetical protein